MRPRPWRRSRRMATHGDAGDEEGYVQQAQLLHADGRTIPADVTLQIITTDGRPSHLVGYFRVRNDGDD